MEMPQVSQCQVAECAYNTDGDCHAAAITVGNHSHPKCDTFCPSSMQGGELDTIAGVGACKTFTCSHNMHLECQSPNIAVGYIEGEVDCLTYAAR